MNIHHNPSVIDLPLAGLRVLDFSQFLAGPSCALRMADLGADVIKVERPDGGDLCRQLVVANQRIGADSALFHTINRNKRSFAADLKRPDDLRLVKDLIARADVMVHNFRPGVMERLQGILALLVRRGVTGKGGRVDASLLETALDLQFEPFTAWLNGAGAPRRSLENAASVHAAAPYGIYRTADGWLALAMVPMDELARLVDCEPLARAAADRDGWYARRDELKRLLQQQLSTRQTAAWLQVLEPAGVWCADVLGWPQLMDHPGFAAIDMVQTLGGGAMRTTRCPLRIDRQVLRHQRPAPAVGEHTQQILQELNLGRPTKETE
jgi:crotonobetainyl-CoA:carnitine CoA-transferase CaiB-like acyl-CoA transferase